MRILVVGGAGYIGSHTVYELIDANHEVIIFDNLSTGFKDNIHPKALFYQGDLLNKTDIEKVFQKEKIDIVMHFAAKIVVPESVEKPLDYYENNVTGSIQLLNAMRKHDVKNIVFSSTASVYEDDGSVCDENHALAPKHPYGESKKMVEDIIKNCEKAFGLKHVIFRYFNVAGTHPDAFIGQKIDHLTHLIPVAIKKSIESKPLMIYGNDYNTKDGTCLRDYIHVVDLAKAHVCAIDYLLTFNLSDIFNLGSGKGFTVFEVAKEVDKRFGLSFEVTERRKGDPAVLVASIEKAKSILKWSPMNSLNQMIESEYAFRSKVLEKNHN